MKKILNRKVYDTDTAECIYHYHNGESGLDEFQSSLYQTSKGEFFEYKSGGPLSIMGLHLGRETTGSRVIVPLTIDEAQDWAIGYADADWVEEYFPSKLEYA